MSMTIISVTDNENQKKIFLSKFKSISNEQLPFFDNVVPFLRNLSLLNQEVDVVLSIQRKNLVVEKNPLT